MFVNHCIGRCAVFSRCIFLQLPLQNRVEDMEELFGMTVDWNDQFQRLLEHPTLNLDQKRAMHENIMQLQQRFLNYAEAVAQQLVIDRVSTQQSQKVKPIAGLGILGGEKFIVGGIFFKFARDDKLLFDGNDALAQKAALNEIKSASALIACNIPRLHTTLSAVFRIKGHCIVATALAPVGRRTLVYGSDDAGDTVRKTVCCHVACALMVYQLRLLVCVIPTSSALLSFRFQVHDDNTEFANIARQIGFKLNLAPHRVVAARGKPDVITICVGADCEGHASGVDGRF